MDQNVYRYFSRLLMWYLRHDVAQVNEWFPPLTKNEEAPRRQRRSKR